MKKNVIGGVYTRVTDGKVKCEIHVKIGGTTHRVFMPLEEMIALRDDINASLTDYMKRMEEKVRVSGLIML